jgi:adenylate kinase family enzyme
MRVAIIGNSGSGKSTLAGQLCANHVAHTLDLDTIAWEPAQIPVPRDADLALSDLRRFCESHEHWIVEGCYGNLIEASLAYGPELIFLNPGLERCLSNCRARPWEEHKYSSKQEQDSKLAFLLQWVTDYYTRDGEMSLGAHKDLFEHYRGHKRMLTEPPSVGMKLT